MSTQGDKSPQRPAARPERRTQYCNLSFFTAANPIAENQSSPANWPAIARNKPAEELPLATARAEELEELGRQSDQEPESQTPADRDPWPPWTDVPIERLDFDCFDEHGYFKSPAEGM